MKRRTILVIAVLIVLAGCQKHVRVTRTTPLPLPPPVVDVLAHADEDFDNGKYPDSARAYESYLQQFPQGSLRDQALFRLGLSRAFNATSPDWAGASTALKQLVDEFPQSLLKPAAALILSLHAEVAQLTVEAKQHDQKLKQLNTQLDKLKQIDAERRKKP